ncbi:MAG TPA: serine hydrolase domain-containing protein [Thermoanaerobaculia bacterium]|nr:serine hydrolase domain-containing protein [Thermoanaerobaculia bacterium]
MREKISALHIPGLSIAVVRDGKIVLARGYGLANLELAAPATAKTVYQLASITKTFTAVATMMLVEEGSISLEDAISKYFPHLPEAWHPVTVRHLLSHTSGISSFASHEKIPCPVGKSEREYTRADALKEVSCLPLDFPPGERWVYGDTGYHLLGMLIEEVAGVDYGQFLLTRIFSPLGMRDTRLNSYAELIAHRADGYSPQGAGFRNAQPLPLFEFANAGLVSTVIDMANFDAALGTEQLLKRATLEQMWTNARLNSGEIVTSYGLGFGLTPFQGRKRVGHSGGGGIGFATTFTRFPREGVTIIILSNADQEGFTISNMANEIASYYFEDN